MPQVLYQVYNHQARRAISLIWHDNIFHDFKVMFIQFNEATNHTVHVSNHSGFITSMEALKGGFIMTYIIYIFISCWSQTSKTPVG